MISRLCMALKIRQPLEDVPMSSGEAGRIIREMSKEVKLKRKKR